MGKFVKLFDVKENTEQVVVTKGYNNEEEEFTITLQTEIPGVTASMTLGYCEEDDLLKAWEKIDQETADAFREDMEKMFN